MMVGTKKGVISTAQLTIQLPESLLYKLRKQAEECDKRIEELIIEKLEKEALSEREQMEKFVHESGLFAPQRDKLGPELRKLARLIPPERKAQLARKASIGKPLSQIIIEDRSE